MADTIHKVKKKMTGEETMKEEFSTTSDPSVRKREATMTDESCSSQSKLQRKTTTQYSVTLVNGLPGLDSAFDLVQQAVLQSPKHNTVHIIYGHTNRHFVHSELTEELKKRIGLQLVQQQTRGAMAQSTADSVLIAIVDPHLFDDPFTDSLLRQAVEASGHPDTRTLFIQKGDVFPDLVQEKLSRSTLLLRRAIGWERWSYERNKSIQEPTPSPDWLEEERTLFIQKQAGCPDWVQEKLSRSTLLPYPAISKESLLYSWNEERMFFWDNLSVMIGKLWEMCSIPENSPNSTQSAPTFPAVSSLTWCASTVQQRKIGSTSTAANDPESEFTSTPADYREIAFASAKHFTQALYGKLECPDKSLTEDALKADDERTGPSRSEQTDFQCCYCSNSSPSASPSSSDGESEGGGSASDSGPEGKECHQDTHSGSDGSLDLLLPVDKDGTGIPSPICNPTWQASSLFTREGGSLRKPGSDVILHVPPDAVNSDSGVVIHAAVCADVARIRCALKLSDDEQVVSPLAEFWAGLNYQFQRPVSVILPHCLPTDFDLENVRVYHVTHSSDISVDIMELKRHSGELKETASLADLDTHIEEKDCFCLEEDHIKVFTNHFSGFACTYCAKKGKSKYRPELYVTASGSVILQHDSTPAQVDVFAFIWDKRMTKADFRQEYGIKPGPLKNLELLPNFKQSQLEMKMRGKNRLTYRLDADGHLLHPGETKTFDLMPYFGCAKCAAEGRHLPMSHQWAMETPLVTCPATALEVSIDVLNLLDGNQGIHPAQTTLILKMKAEVDQDSRTQQQSTTTQTSANQQRSSTTQTDTDDFDNTLVKHMATACCTDYIPLNSAAASSLQRAVSNGDAAGATHSVPANGSTASTPAWNGEQQNHAMEYQHPPRDTTNGRPLGGLQGASFQNCNITIHANAHNNNVNKMGKMDIGNVTNYHPPGEVEVQALDYPCNQSQQPSHIPVVELPRDTSLQESGQGVLETGNNEDRGLQDEERFLSMPDYSEK